MEMIVHDHVRHAVFFERSAAAQFLELGGVRACQRHRENQKGNATHTLPSQKATLS
jgi:hypothetical protein